MYIYVAGPYTSNKEENTKNAIRVADKLTEFGHTPFVPHLSHYWDLEIKHDYDFWMHQCLMWLVKCDCLLRLPGESRGADAEEVFARANGIPVFYSVEDCLKCTFDFKLFQNWSLAL